MNYLRILSLLPAATEIVYLLGLEKYLVGVSDDCDYPAEAKKAARVLDGDVKIISLEPESIDDILENILLVGEACDKNHESWKIVSQLKSRLTKLNSLFKIHSSKRPKVLVIEWLDPLMVAGHWVPEMIERAGGVNLITTIGQRSISITTDQIVIEESYYHCIRSLRI